MERLIVAAALGVAAAAAAGTYAPLVINQGDSGERIVLPRRRLASLRLSNRWLWSAPRLRGKTVRLSRVEYKRNPGFNEWVIERRARGASTITSNGRANCRNCDLRRRHFRVTVVVRR